MISARKLQLFHSHATYGQLGDWNRFNLIKCDQSIVRIPEPRATYLIHSRPARAEGTIQH
jgi:hypothetical protein